MAVLIKIKAPTSIQLTDQSASRSYFSAGRRRKQDPAIVDKVLKAMRGHIDGRGVERVFISCLGPCALALQNLVNLTLDLGQV